MDLLNAKGRWTSILLSLGVKEEYLTKRQGPCPMCGGKDRYRYVDWEGTGGYFCNQCGSGNGFQLLVGVNSWDNATALREIEQVIGGAKIMTVKPFNAKANLKKIKVVLTPIKEEVSGYLHERGLHDVPIAIKQATLPYYEGKEKLGDFPCMVCLVSSQDNRALTYHLTYIKDNKKLDVASPRKIMTPIEKINGGAVRLHPVAEEIAVAEGIETALAVHDKTKLPVFSCLNAGNLANFEPPKEVKRVIVYGDNDVSFVGQEAAFKLASRLIKKGYSCEVKIPKKAGWDWLDVYIDGREKKIERWCIQNESAPVGKLVEQFNGHIISLDGEPV